MPLKKPIKILLISPYFLDSFDSHLSMGSAVKQAVQLSKKYSVLVLTTGRKNSLEKFNKNLTVKSVPGFLLPDPVNYVFSPCIFSEFFKVVKIFKPDLVMVSKFMFFTSFIIPLARLIKLRVITTTDTFPGINWFPRSRFVAAIMWFYARLVGLPLLWLSNKVVLLYPGLSPIARKYHLNFTNIPNGIDFQKLKAMSTPKDVKKPKNEFWVGFVGRHESVKGYDLLLKLSKKFRSNSQVKFVFVGGNTSPHQHKNCLYLGFRLDIVKLYQFFDTLILPSYAEGFPNVLLEAMAQGVPCIASNIGGVPYIIQHKKNGLLVKPGSLNQINKSLKVLISNQKLRHRLSQEAKVTIANYYNWDKIIEDYDYLFAQILSK